LESGSGEKTPTYEHADSDFRENKNGGRSYLDEELPIIIRGRDFACLMKRRKIAAAIMGEFALHRVVIAQQIVVLTLMIVDEIDAEIAGERENNEI
uniref:Reverse transcriptase domain-containing protein n=1 Tax=Gongylonema pulchrum TaxID=637853 RepID=A0A183DBH4_9BILA